MKFSNPDILFWLWALVPVAGFLIYGIRKREKILANWADRSMIRILVPGYTANRYWAKAVLIVLALGCAVFALAGPRMGFHWEKTTQKGVDIMIALDCSRSMLAQDIKPTRLERAKREIIDLLRLMHSDRAGLVAFAGQAILQCPLTLDHEAFHIFLRVLEPDYLPVGGTNLPAAIEACYSGFEKESTTDKAIILITDGENTAGPVDEVVEKMAKQGVRVFCIGVGAKEGAPVPDPNGGFKKDDAGNIILSKVDEAVLEKIAAQTRGRYVRSVAGDMDLDLIYSKDMLKTMERKSLDQGRKKVWEQRFQWFLFPCVFLLILEFLLGPVDRKLNPGKSVLPVLAALVLVFGMLSGKAQAASPVREGITAYETGDFAKAQKKFIDAQLKNPEDPRLYYNIGTAAYMNQEYEQAEKNFTQAAGSTDPELSHKARFNLANTRYRMGKLDQAAKGYEKILEAFPQDQAAKENLDFVKQKIEEQKQQQNQSCDNPDKDNQDDKKDQDQKDNSQNKDQQDQDKQQQDQQNQDQQQQDQNQDQSGKKDQDKGNKSQTGQDQQKKEQSQGQPEQAPPEQAPPEPKQDENKAAAGGNQDPQAGEKDQQQAQAAAAQAGQADPSDKTLENKLNRLEDKPGMALMPMVQQGTGRVKKDW